ncbi:MAG: sulfotransferase family protein [Planctomycetaceae bacterium]
MTARLKHRWSISNNYLAGITAGMWWKLLRENRFAVDPAYWHRAAMITLASLINSYNRRKEERKYGAMIERTEIVHSPLFILGHWRSGTTHLHYILAKDTRQFTFANTYQVVNPYTFLSTEEVNTRRFASWVPERRPMDNMELGFHTPQEDEFAPLLMTLKSLYLGISFPRREEFYSRYLTFRDVPAEEVEQWKQAFLWFCKKLTMRENRSLLLKSPPHTARVRLLLEMFPEARFVHIYRDPFAVFQSQRHYFDTTMWYTYLQKPDLSTIEANILRRYRVLYEAYFADRELIPADRLHEFRFEDLERNPVAETRNLYEKLDLPGFTEFEPDLKAYVESLADYEKNRFAPLDEPTKQKIRDAWGENFKRWGYSMD